MAKTKKIREIESSLPEPSRRSFLSILWIGLGTVAFFELAALVIAFLRPNNKRATARDTDAIIDAGRVENFPLNSVTAFVRGKFYLCRMEDGGFLAVSRKCTHLGCTVPWVDEKKKFACPCHGSSFDIRGQIITPPAPRALDIFHLFIENQTVKVDTARPIKRSEFLPEQLVYPRDDQQ